MATWDSISPQQTVTRQANFIPEMWSDEIIATYEANLVLASKVRKVSMKGKLGDTVHVPKPARGSTNAKVAETAVTLNDDTAGKLDIVVDQHFEYSQMLEDMADIQSLDSARAFYTEDAGYALAKQVDTDLFALGTGLGDGAGGAAGTPANWEHTHCIRAVDAASANSWELFAEDTTISTDTFTDGAFRQAMQMMDDLDVPASQRCLVLCPSAVNKIRGIDRYNSIDFVNNKGVANGQISNIYGVSVYVSTNVSTVETAGQNAGYSDVSRGNILMHKDAYVLAEQLGVRSQFQYKLEHIAELFVADRIYGKKVYRPENAVVIVTAE